MTSPNDTCACGHSAASHGFGYEDPCIAGHASGDTRDACACGKFSLATKGEEFKREDGRNPVRPTVPQVDKLILLPDDQPDGFWLVRHQDGTPLAAFLDELGALRFAVGNRFSVCRQAWGEFSDE